MTAGSKRPSKMDWVLETIKLIGAVLGIATAGFIVFDRVFRNRPIFALHAAPRVPGDNYLFLRIKNILDEDIVVENWVIRPKIIGLSTDTSIRSIVEAQVGNIPTVILPPFSELKLKLIILGAATNRQHDVITIAAQWDTTRKPWPFPRHIRLKTTVARLEALKGAHQGKPEDA